ncbi:Dolichyl-phosphate-mannose-protein mannosyltransferase [Tritrichomonas foetus]|uniref:Dolichyl-phosphate-mannose-protein mannosyltransferase n=1 Tax=Tritrichomonas foetus TaxID=1144522 RepID=A0A1J4JFJ0_9EUKA|nr:Dolichyl-phosphate-mannose-protein mannosyltransferase [Tritrichomonas foetus]|eukprot:OHS96411.1 Dolichyl-phosphate-mannose-protein mannosyltransferase [Tritrichomonas foetus]
MLKFPLQKKERLTTADSVLVLSLTFTSLVVHMWMLQHPDYVVFDEVHFGNFINYYTKSEYFFDIHPPAGKLLMFLLSNFSQYDGNIDFEGLYAKQYQTPDYVILRIIPAFFSSFCGPLIYLAMRYSNFGYSASFTSAFLIIFETSLLTEHRFILSDGMLHFFSCLFIAYFSYFTGLPFNTTNYFYKLIISGVLLGLACACKNTAWGLMIYTGIIEIAQICQYVNHFSQAVFDEIVLRGFSLLGLVICVHLISFVIHTIILYYDGSGTPYLPPMMQKQLINSSSLSGELWSWRTSFPSVYLRVVSLVVNMHAGNMGITMFHPYMSRPQNWPLLTGNFVAFWNGPSNTEVDCIGNVFVYYSAFFALFFVIVGFKKPKWDIAMRFVIGWAASYFPFYLIPRSMYLYHYQIPLIFGCMAAGAAIELWLNKFWRGVFCAVLCVFTLFGFYLWAPLSYGTPHLEENMIIWTKDWRYGDKFHRDLAAKNR